MPPPGPSLPRRLRHHIVGLVVALAAVSCGGAEAEPTPTELDTVSVRVARLHDRIAEVATLQRAADDGLGSALDAVRRLDEVVGDLGNAERVDVVQDVWPGVDAALSDIAPSTLRQPLIDLALAVDGARVTLRETAAVLDQAWERAYTDAEDEVLTAVRSYAETADRLAQVLARNWEVYEQARALAAQFVEQRWFYRSPQEAADAFTVKVGGLIGPLSDARDHVAAAVAEREAAAAEVNRASAAAAERWRARPVGSSSPAP